MNNPQHLQQLQKIKSGLRRRYRFESVLKSVSALSVFIGLLFLVVFFGTLVNQGKGAFLQTYVKLDLDLAQTHFAEGAQNANYPAIIRQALEKIFPGVSSRRNKKAL